MDDRDLVTRTLEGDISAFRYLVEEYQGRIYNGIYGMVRNREDAMDLTIDTFVKAYKSLSKYRLETSFYTWVYRIGMNFGIDHLRRMKHRNYEEYDDNQVEYGAVITPDKVLENKRLRKRILESLDELPYQQRQIILLREVEGLSYKEISEIMDIPEGTAMSKLFYARKRLQDLLKEE
ncbi:MAG: sigma-70 family RNA polymerase sigma factor [Nanoarchaeota archaeon]|nr:sigma-70 family RNA polymerase sigma factor [Nanoarchaeota archaeon]